MFLMVLLAAACQNSPQSNTNDSPTQKAVLQNNLLDRIEIKEWNLSLNNSYLISMDSIVITRKSLREKQDTYSKAITDAERLAITEALKKIDLKSIKKSYVDNSAPDNLPEYDFTLTIDNDTKTIHIYQTKVDDILYLTKQINLLLPEKYQIGYTEKYFK